MDICMRCEHGRDIDNNNKYVCMHDDAIGVIMDSQLRCEVVRGPYERCYLLERGVPWKYRERIEGYGGDDRYQIHHCDSPVCPTCDEQAHRMNEAKVKLAEIEVIENSIGFISECSLEDHE